MPRTVNVSLTLITIRVRSVDVERAKKIAKRTDTPYQHVIRGWIADGSDHATRPSKRSR